jgi:hypothetical protein
MIGLLCGLWGRGCVYSFTFFFQRDLAVKPKAMFGPIGKSNRQKPAITAKVFYVRQASADNFVKASVIVSLHTLARREMHPLHRRVCQLGAISGPMGFTSCVVQNPRHFAQQRG